MSKNDLDLHTGDEIGSSNGVDKIIKVVIKLIIAALLVACWADILAGYSNLFQVASFVGGLWISYKELRADNFITMIFSLASTFFLNPFYPLYFNAATQHITFLILAIGFLGSAIFDLFKSSPDHEASKFNN